MTNVLDDEGLRALREFAARGPLCLFDFDGTLAPLAPDPAGVLLPHAVQSRLQALQARAPVGIVTGRSLADLRSRLEFAPDYLVGNHGLEGVPGERRRTAELSEACERWRAWLAPRLPAIDSGIWLEDKQLSLSIHYLQARDPQAAETALLSLFASLSPAPRILPGKFIFSLLPAGRGDKGEAVLQLLRSTGAAGALYVGDDVTDEDVFRLQHPAIFSVRVEPSASSTAPWYITDHAAMLPLLDRLIDCLPQRRHEPGHAGRPA